MDIQEIARNTFTISALLLSASIIVLNYSWKRLNAILQTMPSDKRRVLIKLKDITDFNEHWKYEYITAHFLACIALVIAVLGAVAAILGMVGVMTGDTTTGIIAKNNFEFAVVSMRVSALAIFLGLFMSAFSYAEELGALYHGQNSIVTTKLVDLPPARPEARRLSQIMAIMAICLPALMALGVVLLPFNQWIQMGITLVVSIGLLWGVQSGYRFYVNRRAKIGNNEDKST